MNCTKFLSILFISNDFLNKFAKILLLKYASEPPLRITQLPDLKHNVETSAVTLGLLSYIIPITPIGIVTFFILRPFGLIHSSSFWSIGSLKLAMVLIDLIIDSILILFRDNLLKLYFLHYY